MSDKEKEIKNPFNIDGTEEIEEIIEIEEDEQEEENDIPFVSYNEEKQSIFEKESFLEFEENSDTGENNEESFEDIFFVDFTKKPQELEEINKEINEDTFELNLQGTPLEDHSHTTENFKEGIDDEQNVFILPDKEVSDLSVSFLDKSTNANYEVQPVEEKETNMKDDENKIEQHQETEEKQEGNTLPLETEKKTKKNIFSFLFKKKKDKVSTAIKQEEMDDKSPSETYNLQDSLAFTDVEQKENKINQVEQENSSLNESEKSKKVLQISLFNNRKLFWSVFGVLTGATIITFLLIPTDEEGGIISKIKPHLPFVNNQTVEMNSTAQTSPSVPPITNETFEEQPQLNTNAPTQEDAMEQEMKELSQKLRPIFEKFGAYVDNVVRTENVIVIKGTIKNENLFEINRLVRMAQVESYPYLVGSLNRTQVVLHKGKTQYSYETSKTVIEFIAKLNYEDRHSSQLWWRKSSTFKNGRNLKATLVKDRLYVDYLHPIYPYEEEQNNNETLNNKDNNSPSKNSSSSEGKLTPDKYDTYETFENKEYGLFFDYPKSIEIETLVKNENSFVVKNKNGKHLPFGFEVTATKKETKANSDDREQTRTAFLLAVDEFENENPNYAIIEKEGEIENFSNQKLLLRKYKAKSEVQDYYITFAVSVIGDMEYRFIITHGEEDSLDAELMLKSSNLGFSEEDISSNDKTTSNDKTASNNKTTSNNNQKTTNPSSTCSIKGDKETKLYYLPESKKYQDVEADLVFCSEDSAQKSGFKKAAE